MQNGARASPFSTLDVPLLPSLLSTPDPARPPALWRENHMSLPESAPSAALEADAHDQQAWRAGFRAGLPTLFGIAAWGMVVGIAMVKAGLSVPQATGMTLLVFAGSAQLASLPLIAANAPIWVIFATALVVNLRFVIFSALLAPHFAHLPWRQRFALGYISGDMTVALFLQRFPDEAFVPGKLSYLKGLMYPNWAAWQVGSIAGVLLGSAVPAQWGLGFAGTLAILCITVPLVVNKAALCGVLVAGAVAVVAAGLPYKLGLLAAVAVGMLAAMAVEETMEKFKERHE
jgi:predicted branched-subunit amino acid permease